MNPLVAMPPGVTATGDRGVFLVTSRSRPKHPPHRVDLEAMACNCERATKGATAQAAARHGDLKWDELCPHMKQAAAAYGLMLAAAVKGTI